jgi:hypothetical protein
VSMNNVKLIQILSSFSRQEMREFEGFIASPYFNRGGRYLVKAFEFIKKYYPAFNHEAFTKEKIYGLMYPREVYNDVRMRKIISGLQKLAEEYLAVSAFRKDRYDPKDYLLEQLSKRKLDNLFELHAKESEKMIEEMPERNERYYFVKYMVNRRMKYFYSFRNRRLSIEFYDKELDNFLYYYLMFVMSKYVERLKEMKSFTQRDFNMPMLNETLSYLETHDFRHTPLMELFYTELKLYLDGDEEYYRKLKKLIKKHEDKLIKNDLKNLYGTLTNYCTEKYEQGRPEYFEELFILYKEILEKDLIEQYLSEFLFLNVVTISLYMNDFKFAEEFVNKYSARLNPANAENLKNYSYANINFRRKEYGKTLQHLLKVNFDDMIQKTLVKNLTLKTYYEQNETEAFISVLDSFRRQLKRERYLPDDIKTLLTNFMDFIECLKEIKEGNSQMDLEELKKNISSSPAAEKKWLLEKAEELG